MAPTETAQIPGVSTRVASGFRDPAGLMCVSGYTPEATDWFKGYGDLFVMTLAEGATRDFHYHQHGIDNVAVLAGAIRIVLFDMRDDSPTRGAIQEVVLEAEPTSITFLQIPPLVAHAFQGVASDSVMVDLASSPEQARSDFLMNQPDSVPYTFR